MLLNAVLRSAAAVVVLLCVPAGALLHAAEPAAQAAAKPAKEIKLFDGTSLKDWKILDKIDFDGHGDVAIKDGELVLGMGRPMTGVKWAGQELPRTNYEITFQARRIEGSDFFCGMTFPVEKSHCSLVLGGWGGSLTGLSSLDGFDASENESTGSMVFKDGQWYKVRLRVTPEKIEVWVDDDQIVDVKIAGRKVSLRWEMDSMPPLGFATYATKGGLKNVVLKPL
jgi:hypothetical protein